MSGRPRLRIASVETIVGIAAAALACAVGCGGGDYDALLVVEADRAVAEHQAEAAPAPLSTEPACHIDQEIAAAVRLRGLPALAPIRCQILDRKVMADRALQISLRDTPKPWIEGQAQWLTLLGLAPDRFDLIPAIASLLDEQLAGFYDPQQDVLFVSPDTADRMTVIHEIVHALQDQHFDLGKRMREAKTSDALSALQILAEGDATSAMIEMPRSQDPNAVSRAVAVMNGLGAFLAEATPTEVPVPAILRRGLIAPYLDGFSLVERLREQGGWGAVNAVWAQTPKASAALLSDDPSHWGNTVKQLGIELPAAPPWRPNLEPLYDDVTGEQTLRVLFEEWLARAGAAEAARGWSGDRVTVWSDAGTSGLFWRMRWASERDTQQALRAFAKGYFKDQASTLVTSAGKVSAWTRGCSATDQNPLALATRDREIVLVVQSRSAGTRAEICAQLANWASAALR